MTSTLSSRGKIALGVLAALVVGVVGFAIGLSVGRPGYPGEGSADVGFARDMIAHHQQAVEMAMIAHQNATRPEIRTMAADIVLTQQNQVGRMQDWLETWGVPETNVSVRPMSWLPNGESMMRGNLMPGMATREEINQLRDATGEQVDILFLQLMLRHHVGGIHMVDGLLQQDSTPEVRAMAENMKSHQQRDIDAMQQHLAALGASPLPN